MQTGSAAEFHDGVLTLSGIGPVTSYFADRPERDVGLVTQDEFLAAWSAGGDSFAADPPNASLTFRDGDKQVVAVVELSNPALVDGGIRYDAKVARGRAAGQPRPGIAVHRWRRADAARRLWGAGLESRLQLLAGL